MLRIGLTGGIGSGKSLVSQFLEEQGAIVVNADLLGHQAYLPGTRGFDQVVAAFGEDIVAGDGHVDRKKLGPIVFADPKQMERLNGIMHPIIKSLIEARLDEIAREDESVSVVEAAVLIEAGWRPIFDEIWVVTSRVDEIVSRLQSRNGMTSEDVQRRIDSQMSSIDRISQGDIVLDNSGTVEELKNKVSNLWRERVNQFK